MNSKFKTVTAAAFALLFVAACGSSGYRGRGGIYGGRNYNTEIRGTVDSVDLNSNSIYLINVSNYNGSMMSNSGNAVRVYFDNRTPVDYQGRSYQASDLERGDQVAVRVDDSRNGLYANSVSVLSDVRNSSPSGSYPSGSYPNGPRYPDNGRYGSTLHGTVRSIDTNGNTITVDAGRRSDTTIQYDSNTPVYFNGSNYTPSDLEVGDEIDIRGSGIGANRYQAKDITVTRSISGPGSTNSGTYGTNGQNNGSMIRGTVTYVDTNRRTITLEGVNYTGFDRNATNGGTITVQYDPSATVDVQGQAYPVTGLQRGDIVDVQVGTGTYNTNANYFTQRIYLVHDVNQR